MLIGMTANATDAEVAVVVRAHPMPGATRTAIGITGNAGAVDPAHFAKMPGVAEAIAITSLERVKTERICEVLSSPPSAVCSK